MNVAIIMYDKMNLVSFSNIFSYLKNFENLNIQTCGFKQEIVDEFGVRLLPDSYCQSLYGTKIMVIPDGIGAMNLRHDDIFLSWIKSGLTADIKIGLNLGTLIYAGAGFLKNHKASIKGGYKNALNEYCEVCEEDICQSSQIITATKWDKEIQVKISQILA